MTYVRRFEPLFGASWFTIGPLLVLAPHPDDEVLSCGGLIAAHRASGHAVHVVVMTDGGRGDAGGAGGAPYTETRRAETHRALDAIGGCDVRFLDVADGTLIRRPDVVERLVEIIRAVRPASIAFPSPIEVHPDHRATAIWGAEAVAAAGHACRVLVCEIGAFMPSNVLLDVTPFWAAKERAIRCYESQLLHHDIVGKVKAQNRARTVNVDDRTIEYVEAFAIVEIGSLAEYLRRSEELVRLVDGMGPAIP